MCNGAVFVKVNPANSSLKSIVLASNPAIAGSPKCFSMSANKGLRSLMELREHISKQMEIAADCDGKPKLFDDPLPKKAKTCRKYLRDAPESIMLPVDIDGVTGSLEVLKAVHPSHNLMVKYDDDMMALLLHVLRNSGFDDNRIKSKTGPKGIHARKKGGFLVMRYNADGSMGRKLTKSYSDAVAIAHESPAGNQAIFVAHDDPSEHHCFPEGLDTPGTQADSDSPNHDNDDHQDDDNGDDKDDDNDDNKRVVESSEQYPADSSESLACQCDS